MLVLLIVIFKKNLMEKFFQTVAQFTNISQESKQDLSGALKRFEFEKGKILVKPYSVCNYLYFVEEGLTRTFYYKNEKDITDWISAENSFAVSLISFITRKPDRRGIELLEPSIIYALHHDELESLCIKHHDIENFVRRLVSFGLIQVSEKFDALHFETALQRYQTLMKNTPALLQRVPLGMIASYLGITQETLSRMRAKISF